MWRRFVVGLGLAAAVLVGGVTAARAEQAITAVAAAPRREADGARTLVHEIVVSASQAEVWRLWSTSEGLASWVAPVAAIDLRVGGIWEASYDPAVPLGDPRTIRNRVLSLIPGRMLSIAIDGAPPNFPHADLAQQLWTVIELEPVAAAQTRVRVTMLGFADGAGFDALYTFFDRGNAYTLDQLNARLGRDAP